jgi:hypothetical protein
LFLRASCGQRQDREQHSGFHYKGSRSTSVDPATVLTVNVWLKLHNEQQLDKLVEQQKQKNSS